MEIPKRTKTEILDYFGGSINKGDIIIHQIKPTGKKEHIEVYKIEVE